MNKFLIIIFTLLSSTAALSDEYTGWIERVTGIQNNVKLVRNENEVSISQFMPVKNGDLIKVLDASTTVEISLIDGKKIKIDNTKTFKISGSGKVPTISSNLMNWLVSLVKNDSKEQRLIMAASRDSNEYRRLSIPMLQDETTLVSGKRLLALSWLGGKAPYEIKFLLKNNQITKAHFDKILSNNIVELINLPPGTYDLIVNDATGATWREKVIAVEDKTVPTFPEEFKKFPPQLNRLLSASWLAGQDDGKWILEAYTMLMENYSESVAEITLKERFESGSMR